MVEADFRYGKSVQTIHANSSHLAQMVDKRVLFYALWFSPNERDVDGTYSHPLFDAQNVKRNELEESHVAFENAVGTGSGSIEEVGTRGARHS